MVNLWEVFASFLKVGALGFGGPFALLALMEKEVVRKKGWLTSEEFAQSTAIGAFTPGPIFFAAAAHVGYRLRGLGGAVVAATASLLPAFLLTVAFAAVYIQIQTFAAVKGAVYGLSAAVVGLLAVVAFRTGKALVRDVSGASLAVLSFAALEFFRLNPVLVITGSAAAGIALHRVRSNLSPRQDLSPPRKQE